MDSTSLEIRIQSHVELSEMWQTLADYWRQRRDDLGDWAKRQEEQMRRNASDERAQAEQLAELLSN